MSLKKLKHLLKYKRLSNYSPENLITDFSLYESAIIELSADFFLEEDEPRIEVNQDIKTLQRFLLHKNAILLPCSECEKEMAFSPCGWVNPCKVKNWDYINDSQEKGFISTNINEYSEESKHQNVFDVTKPQFRFGEEIIISLNDNDLTKIQDSEIKTKILNDCISECKYYLLKHVNEIRKEYKCSLDPCHRVSVYFRIYDPIELEDMNEYSERIIKGDDELTKAYEYLHDCLIIQKVGQHPSLADMQMFEVEKYRSVLGKENRNDLARAIGLYAHGIGAGSFLYLRRIIERLVENAHQEEMKKDGWDDEIYLQGRFDDRIKILESKGQIIFPETLKNIKSKLYGVLSKGVHENNDEECLELFPFMQFAIEQILDKQIAKKELDEKLKKLNAKLNK